MKRFLLIFSAFVVCFSLLAVPSFANEIESFSLYVGEMGTCMDGPPIPVGRYRIDLVISGSGQQVLISDNYLIESIDLCISLPEVVFDGESYSIQFCPDVGGLSTVDIYAEDGEYSLGECILRFTTFVPEPSPNEGFLSDIGEFFTYCVTCLADVALLIVSNPALLILSIGFILIIFVVVVVKRF